MGLFDFLGEIIAAPIQVTATVARATVKTTGHLVTGQTDRIEDDLKEAGDELQDTADKVKESLG